MLMRPADFLAAVRRLCDEHGTLLIADEVFTGFGRTGRMFACEHAGISPDIICLSKALTAGYLPLGATVATEHIYEAFLSDDRTKAFFHGHSFTANPLACAVAVASLDLFARRTCSHRVRRLERQLAAGLGALRDRPRSSRRACPRRGRCPRARRSHAAAADAGYLDAIGPTARRRFPRARPAAAAARQRRLLHAAVRHHRRRSGWALGDSGGVVDCDVGSAGCLTANRGCHRALVPAASGSAACRGPRPDRRRGCRRCDVPASARRGC